MASPRYRNWLDKIYRFNVYRRHQWVAAQAKLTPPGARVLDAGAGSCPYREIFAHCRYETHDFAQLAPEQLLGGQGYGRIDHVGDLNHIPVPDQSFEVVLCTEVLEHVPEPVRSLQEFARILKPGGKLLLTAPLGSGLHQEPYHFYGGFTPYWYARFLPEAGFSGITIEANGGFWQLLGQESLRGIKRLAPWKGRQQLLRLPFWLLLLPAAGIIPILGLFTDPQEPRKTFTVGYHVSARRN